VNLCTRTFVCVVVANGVRPTSAGNVPSSRARVNEPATTTAVQNETDDDDDFDDDSFDDDDDEEEQDEEPEDIPPSQVFYLPSLIFVSTIMSPVTGICLMRPVAVKRLFPIDSTLPLFHASESSKKASPAKNKMKCLHAAVPLYLNIRRLTALACDGRKLVNCIPLACAVSSYLTNKFHQSSDLEVRGHLHSSSLLLRYTWLSSVDN